MYRILLIFLLLGLTGCTLFLEPLVENEYDTAENNYIIDSLIIDSPGLYQFVISSSNYIDIIFFNDYSGIEYFKDEQIYSQTIMYPLFFRNMLFADQEVFIHVSGSTLYYVIDNTDILTKSYGDADVNVKVYLKEE